MLNPLLDDAARRAARIAAISAQLVKIAPKLTEAEFLQLIGDMTAERVRGTVRRNGRARPRKGAAGARRRRA